MFGISSYCYGWAVGEGRLDSFGLLEIAASHGIRLVQLSDHLSLHALDDDALRAIRRRADALGIVLEAGMRGMTPESVRAYLRVCDALGAALLRVVVDGPGYEPSEAEVVRVLAGLVEDLRAQGVVLAIENHDRFGSRVLADIVQRAGSAQVGVCLDTVNSMGAGEGVETVLNNLLPLAVNVHLKDFAVVRLPHMQGFCVEGRPLGEGMLPAGEMLARLRGTPHAVNVLLELWTPPEDTMEATLAKEVGWAARSMERMMALC